MFTFSVAHPLQPSVFFFVLFSPRRHRYADSKHKLQKIRFMLSFVLDTVLFPEGVSRLVVGFFSSSSSCVCRACTDTVGAAACLHTSTFLGPFPSHSAEHGCGRAVNLRSYTPFPSNARQTGLMWLFTALSCRFVVSEQHLY